LELAEARGPQRLVEAYDSVCSVLELVSLQPDPVPLPIDSTLEGEDAVAVHEDRNATGRQYFI
jgi:hypothetical protein